MQHGSCIRAYREVFTACHRTRLPRHIELTRHVKPRGIHPLIMLDKNPLADQPLAYRTIRSFVRREGRMTKGQQNALDTLWPQYGIDTQDSKIDFTTSFDRQAPCILEIGLGMGDALIHMAESYPQYNYIGIEVYRPGIGSLLKKLDVLGLTNVKVINDDAVEVLPKMIPDVALDAVYIFFPDPWPKKRHRKRRLIQLSFVKLLSQKIKQGGVLHLATDWENYAQHMMNVIQPLEEFVNMAGQYKFSPRPEYRPLTKFELRGQCLGHKVWDLIFTKTCQGVSISNRPNTPSSPQ